MPLIQTQAKLSQIGDWTIIRLPDDASKQLPSRGMAMVEGTINDFPFQIEAEPDGKGSHWFRLDADMLIGAGAEVGDTVSLAIEPSKEWPEPEVPVDLKNALAAATPEVQALWKDITPISRWDWIRWINGTKNPDTRKHRIEVAISKLTAGNRRPCCFNRASCTVPEVSHNGMLMEVS